VPQVEGRHALTAAYYLLVMERHAQASTLLKRVSMDQEQSHAAVQCAYLQAYLAYGNGEDAEAKRLAEPFLQYPVERWARRFQDVVSHIDDATQHAISTSAKDDKADTHHRQRELDLQAGSSPVLDFTVEGDILSVEHENVPSCSVAYFKMDLELLFSKQPFLVGTSTNLAQFASICPNHSQEVTLPPGGKLERVPIPSTLAGTDVMVEVAGAGLRKSLPLFANTMRVRVMESYGQVKACDSTTGAPLAATYVKCYARTHSGTTTFHKDGYTDRRGRFDYATLSTGRLSDISKFALFVASPTHGAVVKDASPPAT